MPRLPEPGGDSGSWGKVLNEFLTQAHTSTGDLKSGVVGTSQLQNNSVTAAKLASGAVTGAVLTGSTGTDGQVLTSASGSSTGLSWATPSGSGLVPDADATTKGLVRLTGDLGGTSASPTVPGLAAKANTASLATVATTGSYTSLTNRPTLATVATSGSYNDLTNKPTIPTLSTVATSGSYNDLTNRPTLSSVATTGSYTSLSNRPTIPAQFNPVAGTNVSLTGSYPNITINATGSGGGGTANVLIWRYSSGVYPTLSSTKPTGVDYVLALGPVQPPTVPSWIGTGPTQVVAKYEYTELS